MIKQIQEFNLFYDYPQELPQIHSHDPEIFALQEQVNSRK